MEVGEDIVMHYHRPCVKKSWWVVTKSDRAKDRKGQQKQRSGVGAIEGALGYKIWRRKKGE